MLTDTTYHFVGIGGIGMSGLARILLNRGYKVTGSDQSASTLLTELKEMGATISIGHHENHVPEGAILVYSSSIDQANPEMAVAKRKGLSLLHRSHLLKALMKDQKPLLVTGTHGKTTITTLLVHLLKVADLDPGFSIGGIAPSYGTNADHGKGEYFVAEADESDGSFLSYDPYGAIISNIDSDHLDYYKNEQNLAKAFQDFAGKVQNQNCLLYCKDDPGIQKLSLPGVSYGFSRDADVRGDQYRQVGWSVTFDVIYKGQVYKNFTLPYPGKHSALNALGVIGMGFQLGIPEDIIRKAILSFSGVKRRVEIKAQENGVIIVDDYGHHPTEISTTLKGLKTAFPQHKLLVYFQPHRYSRTQDCLREFGNCFDNADELVITDIYAAGEAEIPGIHAGLILDEVKKNSTIKAEYVSKDKLLEDAEKRIQRFTIVVTQGAGDITQLGPKISLKNVKKLKLGLIFGGKSAEHEISLRSAKNVYEGIDRSHFDVTPFFISKNGGWVSKDAALDCLKGGNSEIKESFNPLIELAMCDVACPILHGQNGEDGTIQGLFEMLSLPYSGCDCFSSAATMDKSVTKKLADYAGLKVAPFVHIHARDWRKCPDQVVKAVIEKLAFPVFVKPVHLGSTIGITKVEDVDNLSLAISKAFQYDEGALVEEEIKGRELEFTVFGDEKLTVFPPGEIKSCGAVYGYNEKYLNQTMETTPQAELPQTLIDEGMEFAKKAYRALECNGFARVDCFLDERGNYLLNEINSIPGCTNSSLYLKIAERHGLKTKDHLTELLLIGLERFRKRERKRL